MECGDPATLSPAPRLYYCLFLCEVIFLNCQRNVVLVAFLAKELLPFLSLCMAHLIASF
jgi:hypothetical protein